MEECIAQGNIEVFKLLVNGLSMNKLHNAAEICIKHGHIHLFEYLINMGIDLHSYGYRYLELAIMNCQMKMIEYLYSCGIKITVKHFSGINKAIIFGNAEMLLYLLSNLPPNPPYKDELNKTFSQMINRGFYNSKILHICLDFGANVSLTMLYYMAESKSDWSIIKRLIPYIDQLSLNSTLYRCINLGDVEMVKHFLDTIAYNKGQVLEHAISNGHLSTIQLVLNRVKLLYSVSNKTITSKHLRMCRKNIPIFEYILNHILDELQYTGDERNILMDNTKIKYGM